MDVKVGVRDVNFKDVEDGFYIQWTMGTLAIAPFAKEIYESVLVGTILQKVVKVADDQEFFIYVGEEGNLSLFDVESREHLFHMKALLVKKWMGEVRSRYLKGRMMFKAEERSTLCVCQSDHITWKDFQPYRERGVCLRPGEVITKRMVVRAYRIIQEAFAEETQFKPQTLEELCLKQLQLPSLRTYLDNKAFWTIPYLLMKHEGLVALSMCEERMNNERVFISLYP